MSGLQSGGSFRELMGRRSCNTECRKGNSVGQSQCGRIITLTTSQVELLGASLAAPHTFPPTHAPYPVTHLSPHGSISSATNFNMHTPNFGKKLLAKITDFRVYFRCKLPLLKLYTKFRRIARMVADEIEPCGG